MYGTKLYLFLSYKAGTINAPETADSERTEVHIFYDHVPDTLTPVAGALRTKWVFLTSIARKKEEALEAYKLGKFKNIFKLKIIFSLFSF